MEEPEPCRYEVFRGSRYGEPPEPPEICGDDAVPGEEFCALHLGL